MATLVALGSVVFCQRNSSLLPRSDPNPHKRVWLCSSSPLWEAWMSEHKRGLDLKGQKARHRGCYFLFPPSALCNTHFADKDPVMWLNWHSSPPLVSFSVPLYVSSADTSEGPAATLLCVFTFSPYVGGNTRLGWYTAPLLLGRKFKKGSVSCMLFK